MSGGALDTIESEADASGNRMFASSDEFGKSTPLSFRLSLRSPISDAFACMTPDAGAPPEEAAASPSPIVA